MSISVIFRYLVSVEEPINKRKAFAHKFEFIKCLVGALELDIEGWRERARWRGLTYLVGGGGGRGGMCFPL